MKIPPMFSSSAIKSNSLLISAPVFSKINSIKSNIDEDPDTVKRDFNSFLDKVAVAMSDKNEQDELNIVKES